MIALLEQMNLWHWLALGLILLLFELLGTAGYLLWLGISAVLVSITMTFLPISWYIQWVCFVVFSLFSTWLWWRYQYRKDQKDSKEIKLNQRGAQMIGRTCVLEDDILAGHDGRIRVGDSTWSVKSTQNLSAGTLVEITAVDGIVLTIEAKE